MLFSTPLLAPPAREAGGGEDDLGVASLGVMTSAVPLTTPSSSAPLGGPKSSSASNHSSSLSAVGVRGGGWGQGHMISINRLATPTFHW